jgi:DNA polymerase (family 10)
MWGQDDASAIQVDVRAVASEAFGAAWQYFTGSKQHNVRLRERAVRRGWKLNEYGLFDGEKCIAAADEKEIYAALELAFVEPELREDRGEIDAATTHTLPTLLTIDDMRGDLHMHTIASDGELTIEGMIEACIARGYEYLCITDHSASLAVANGLSDDRLRRHVADVRRAAKKYEKQIAVYAGSEVDILSDGRLDYDEALLNALDIVTASVHVAQNQSSAVTTDRIKRAMDCRAVRIIGHLTGRLLGMRPAMEMDVAELIRYAAATKTCLELNASWQRLDVNDVNLRLAKSHGVKITISTDAHTAEHLDSMALGVYTARRGWLEKGDVVNAMNRAAFDAWVKAGK